VNKVDNQMIPAKFADRNETGFLNIGFVMLSENEQQQGILHKKHCPCNFLVFATALASVA